ncbi:MAG TPA: biotin--[acetyl-CoA-carboxylase] ligase [Jatrophihabitans sp.]|jgi:BirA family biotin operon repressor/biotin-[acetyl-CoA-carboxylase] ligase|nr:biotin--[acetyl-CoA-carboxylase] ligase [Jatrophihabitans sp.]
MKRRALDLTALSALAERWARIEVVEETASTNADLLADPDAPDRSMLAAEHQTAGRGRFDRSWSSPPRAGLTFSVLFRPGVPMARWGWLPLLAGLAVHEAVTEVPTRLKWPNDLLAAQDERKLAGILAQSTGDAVVVGIGLNVDTTAAELPVDTATSLALSGAGVVDRTVLLAGVLTRLETRYTQWVDAGGDAAVCGVAAAYRGACATIGARVRVAVAAGADIEGDALDVDELGRLVVRTPTGEESISAGDVEHLRVD